MSPPHSGSGSGEGAVAPVATLPIPGETSAEAVPALGSVIAEKYRIEELIARGGMGAVYMATHLISGKRVALKWMLPSLGQMPGAKERFEREASATARIDHPNVIDIYDVGTDRGSVYLVMELLRGETLAEYLQRTEYVGAEEAVQLIMPALRGVAAAHSHKVIHRDLKPDNIYLCRSPDGEPRELRVLDFGISKIGSEGDARNLSLTRSGAVMGTPYYMSPEQVRGVKDVDERGDIYAFGVILYEMLTGRRPFDAETYNQLILKIATEDPPPITELRPHIDRRLVAVVERAMAREPSARYPNIEALAVALEPFASGTLFRASFVRSQTPEVSSGEHLIARGRSRASGRRSRSYVALGILLGCLSAGLGFWALSQRARQLDRVQPDNAVRPAPPIAAGALVDPRETAVSASAEEPASAPASEVAEQVRGASLPPVEIAPPAVPEQVTAKSPEVERTRVRGRERDRKLHETPRELASDPGAPVHGEPAAKLPEDWDERLSIPAAPPERSSSPAGRIDASDLR